jgi:hypothetical protein
MAAIFGLNAAEIQIINVEEAVGETHRHIVFQFVVEADAGLNRPF